MKYLIFLSILLICSCGTRSNDKSIVDSRQIIINEEIPSAKKYELIQKTENADIRYADFDKFSSISLSKDEMKTAFEPKKGDFIVYNFIAVYEGISKLRGNMMFEDYIILKINTQNNHIIDGYQFTMGWAEPPPSFDLYRVSRQGIELINDLDIEILQFSNVENTSSKPKYLNENGKLQLE